MSDLLMAQQDKPQPTSVSRGNMHPGVYENGMLASDLPKLKTDANAIDSNVASVQELAMEQVVEKIFGMDAAPSLPEFAPAKRVDGTHKHTDEDVKRVQITCTRENTDVRKIQTELNSTPQSDLQRDAYVTAEQYNSPNFFFRWFYRLWNLFICIYKLTFPFWFYIWTSIVAVPGVKYIKKLNVAHKLSADGESTRGINEIHYRFEQWCRLLTPIPVSFLTMLLSFPYATKFTTFGDQQAYPEVNVKTSNHGIVNDWIFNGVASEIRRPVADPADEYTRNLEYRQSQWFSLAWFASFHIAVFDNTYLGRFLHNYFASLDRQNCISKNVAFSKTRRVSKLAVRRIPLIGDCMSLQKAMFLGRRLFSHDRSPLDKQPYGTLFPLEHITEEMENAYGLLTQNPDFVIKSFHEEPKRGKRIQKATDVTSRCAHNDQAETETDQQRIRDYVKRFISPRDLSHLQLEIYITGTTENLAQVKGQLSRIAEVLYLGKSSIPIDFPMNQLLSRSKGTIEFLDNYMSLQSPSTVHSPGSPMILFQAVAYQRYYDGKMCMYPDHSYPDIQEAVITGDYRQIAKTTFGRHVPSHILFHNSYKSAHRWNNYTAEKKISMFQQKGNDMSKRVARLKGGESPTDEDASPTTVTITPNPVILLPTIAVTFTLLNFTLGYLFPLLSFIGSLACAAGRYLLTLDLPLQCIWELVAGSFLLFGTGLIIISTISSIVFYSYFYWLFAHLSWVLVVNVLPGMTQRCKIAFLYAWEHSAKMQMDTVDQRRRTLPQKRGGHKPAIIEKCRKVWNSIYASGCVQYLLLTYPADVETGLQAIYYHVPLLSQLKSAWLGHLPPSTPHEILRSTEDLKHGRMPTSCASAHLKKE